METWLPVLNIGGIILVSLINYLSNRKTHQLVNSRMTEILDLTRKSSYALGVKEEKERGK